jgi:hypothetical protein
MQIELSADTQTRLNALLDYVGTTAKDADGFVREQAPMVAQEIVAWKFGVGVAQLSFGVVLIVVWVMALITVLREEKKPFADRNEMVSVPCGMFLVMGGVFMCILTVGGIYDTLRASVAPRLVVIDYIKAAK